MPSGVCIHVGEDHGFVIVAYFYAKQIFPHRVCTWKNGDLEQKSGESGTGRLCSKGKDSVFFFAFCEVVTELADNNMSSISVPAISTSSINRSLNSEALSVKTDCFVDQKLF